MIRRFPAPHRSAALIAALSLPALLISACGQDESCAGDSCGGAGAPSSGGSGPGGGAAPTGGIEAAGGGIATGGVGGAAGESSQSSGGNAGEESSGSGGATGDDSGPRVTELVIDGRSVDSGETLSGVREGASIKAIFSRPMDTLSVEDAFVARSDESSLASFVVGWNADDTELTLALRARVKYEEVTTLAAEPRQLGFLLTKKAKDAEGRALEEEAIVIFSLLRRLTQFIGPDLTNSTLAYGNVPSALLPTEYLAPIEATHSDCAWFNPENEHDGYHRETFREEFPYSFVANFSSVPGRDGNNPKGTSVAVYSFPLAEIPTSGLESATLKLAKSMRVRLDTGDRDGDGSVTDYVPYYSDPFSAEELPFSVDALPSFVLPMSRTSAAAEAVFGTSSLRPNLENSLGHEYSKGFGFFEFDVTGLVETGVASGDAWAMYRADFDGLPVVRDAPMTVCVTMGLETVSLVE